MRYVVTADGFRWLASAVLSLCLTAPGLALRARHPGSHRRHARRARRRRPRRPSSTARSTTRSGRRWSPAHHLHAAGSAAGRAGHRADRGAAAVQPDARLRQLHLLRRRPVADHRVAGPARRLAGRDRFGDRWSSTPSTTTRTRSCSAPTRWASSTTARWRAKGRRAARRSAAARAGTQRGGISAFNPNWDGDWVVRAQVTERGWEAEMAIPLKTLRYAAGERQDLGLQRPAQHPPQERAGLPGDDPARLRHLPRLAGRQGAGPEHAARAATSR